jgi:hypothetical protein
MYQVWIRRLNPFHYYRVWRIRRIISKLPPVDRSAYGGKIGEYIDIISKLELPPRAEAGSEANMLRALKVISALDEARRKA